MDIVNTLRAYGLFDAKVPRYTSYPPANRFLPDVGHVHQPDWLADIAPRDPVSVYIHIPFCRRLCWFCACRTQGTKTLKPVDDYLTDVIAEIRTVAARVPEGLKMARLHLGGGTPTLLTARQMNRLLDATFGAFGPTDDFEFSVEIDPTEADKAVLYELANWGMARASIGVQDFARDVQEAIGRTQSFDETQRVIDLLRADGVKSLNIDLLYGLPHQTAESLVSTLNNVVSLRPDRLALYGYAHVPHMSKRQVMIPADALPGVEARFGISRIAEDQLKLMGYQPLGIDHFALPHDSLARAAKAGRMRRNFQGYTDDPCTTLLGFGASAISQFPQGYVQNAVSTAVYRQRVQAEGLAAHKGYVLSPSDQMLSDLISRLMCDGRIDLATMTARHPGEAGSIASIFDTLTRTYPDAVRLSQANCLEIREGFAPMSRLMAARIDSARSMSEIHSLAI